MNRPSVSTLNSEALHEVELEPWSERATDQLSVRDRKQAHHEQIPIDRESPLRDQFEPRPADSLLTDPGLSGTAKRKSTLAMVPERIRKVHRSKRLRNALRDWAWELSAWVFATISIAAVVILLLYFDQRLVSEWKSHIGINTLIAVLSQASVSALLVPVTSSIGQLKWVWYKDCRELSDLEAYDLASRGPAGGIKFLFRRRGIL